MYKALITLREDPTQFNSFTDTLEKEYVEYFRSIDIVVFPVSNYTDELEFICDTVNPDMIILAGGGMLSEDSYLYKTEGFRQRHRDFTEKKLLDMAIEKNIPVFGICRGMQYINSYFGGKISSFDNITEPRPIAVSHEVECDGNSMIVSSFHPDGIITALGKNLEPIAIDTVNGVIEAYRHRTFPIVAVQWHPERLGNDEATLNKTETLIKELLAENNITK